MKTVYIAGAMSGDSLPRVMQNIHRGILLGSEALEAGFAPFTPHLDVFFQLLRGEDLQVEKQQFYDYSMEWLMRSDYVLVCAKSQDSYGTNEEIKKAIELGIPVFSSVEDLLEHSKLGEF